MSGMYNFRTGGGKSPSFFFFPDNNRLMLKTLKDSEHEIIFKKGFLLDYFKYIDKQPESLLTRIYGVYEMQIGEHTKISFILTDNMVGLDHARVLRCFDLKGSLLGRHEKVTEEKLL
jgi:1-phosphatidylinositol-4-phosphate 5-kinase